MNNNTNFSIPEGIEQRNTVQKLFIGAATAGGLGALVVIGDNATGGHLGIHDYLQGSPETGGSYNLPISPDVSCAMFDDGRIGLAKDGVLQGFLTISFEEGALLSGAKPEASGYCAVKQSDPVTGEVKEFLAHAVPASTVLTFDDI